MEILNNNNLPNIYDSTVAIVGLGYVGLPLAIEISYTKKCLYSGKDIIRRIIGFDINEKRISELKNNIDNTSEINSSKLKNADNIKFTSNIIDLFEADIYIVTVPTPIDKHNKPDLTFLKKASKLIGQAMKERKKNNIPMVIFESTVYPGATEEVSIPLLEEYSNLKIDSCNKSSKNKSFACGYSPERVNPGDNKISITDIVKVTSGSTENATEKIDLFYKSFIKAGTFKVSSIKIAEAAKVIENTQRDVNIALINELSKIFNLMHIDTGEVLDAAASKWNFLKFKPGMVGGHCIGVDPYYLTYKAAEYGYHAEMVLSGRRINESMSKYISDKFIVELCKKGINIPTSKILIMGVTFKENCPDIRNSKVFDLADRLNEFRATVDLYDPLASINQVYRIYNKKLNSSLDNINKYSGIVVAVSHKEFKEKDDEFWFRLVEKNTLIFDVKGILPRHERIIRL